MQHPHHTDEVRYLREQLRQRIDAAARSLAETLQVAADLMLAARCSQAAAEPRRERDKAGAEAEMLTSREAAAYLGISPGTLDVWRSRRSYPIPFVKIGKNVRYRKADLDDFVQRRTRGDGGEGTSR